MDKAIDRIIRNYIESVNKQQLGLSTAYLFGSYANNKQRNESDIDIALVIDDLPDNKVFDTQVKLMMIASKIDNRIEPHPISRQDIISNNPFASEIVRTGIEFKI
jgi:uncharacterized protein